MFLGAPEHNFMTEHQIKLISELIEYKILLEKIDDFYFISGRFYKVNSKEKFDSFREAVLLEILKIEDRLSRCY